MKGPGLLSLIVIFGFGSCESSEVAEDFKNRVSDYEIAEDPLVVEYLKQLQGTSDLVPSQEGENVAQTFNNSLVVMAFILSNEKERAERILDFYANATDPDNDIRCKQNFFYNGEARGFYQSCSISTKCDESGNTDRWMGDMAWLLLAYKFYEREYDSNRYSTVVALLRNLLVSFYIPAGNGGYVQSGWRKGDTMLHETNGHHEGNLDAYAALKLSNVGVDTHLSIKTWIDEELSIGMNNQDLPLDLYTWRTLVFGDDNNELLSIPENDTRYRKEITFNNKKVVGFYSGPDESVNNIWTDGTAHMACAYFNSNNIGKGNFYSNRLSDMLITNVLGSISTRTLPYATNTSGGYGWVNPSKGFSSSAAWYIIIKHKLNPLGGDNFKHN